MDAPSRAFLRSSLTLQLELSLPLSSACLFSSLATLSADSTETTMVLVPLGAIVHFETIHQSIKHGFTFDSPRTLHIGDFPQQFRPPLKYMLGINAEQFRKRPVKQVTHLGKLATDRSLQNCPKFGSSYDGESIASGFMMCSEIFLRQDSCGVDTY